MKKLRGLAALMALAAAAVPCFALCAGAEEVKQNASYDSSSVSYSWYWDVDPFLEAEDMSVFRNYQGDNSESGQYSAETQMYYTLDRMNMLECVPFQQNGKWGLIDYEGNVLLRPTYDVIEENAAGKMVGSMIQKTSNGSAYFRNRVKTYEYSSGFLKESNYMYELGTAGRSQRSYYWVEDENMLYFRGAFPMLSSNEDGKEDRTVAAQLGAVDRQHGMLFPVSENLVD